MEIDVIASSGVREIRYLATWHHGQALISTQKLHQQLIGPFTSTPQTLTLMIGTDIDALFDVVSFRAYAQERTQPNPTGPWGPWSALSDASEQPQVVNCVAGVGS